MLKMSTKIFYQRRYYCSRFKKNLLNQRKKNIKTILTSSTALYKLLKSAKKGLTIHEQKKVSKHNHHLAHAIRNQSCCSCNSTDGTPVTLKAKATREKVKENKKMQLWVKRNGISNKKKKKEKLKTVLLSFCKKHHEISPNFYTYCCGKQDAHKNKTQNKRKKEK